MELSLMPQRELRTRHSSHEEEGEEEDDDDIGSMSSFSEDEGSSNSMDSSASSELTEDASSSNSSLSSFPDQSANNRFDEGPLFEMSSLITDLPHKRGLSKFFQGKSQSFTSLSKVMSLEDLAKPDRPYSKRLKSCKSYGGALDWHKQLSPKHSAKGSIAKKASKGSLSSLGMRRRRFLGIKPPMPPPATPRSRCISGQTLLFA